LSDEPHEFGSQSTELKLSVVEKYLNAFTTALTGKFPELWYFDAFAGTGSRTVRTSAREGGLFHQAEPERVEQRRGSARIALDVSPPFDRVIFIESNPRYCAALRALKAEFPSRKIDVIEDDANKAIQEEMKRLPLHQVRGVMFIDPYGMDVDWDTLTAIGRTGAIDVWYLFSLSGLYRQAAHNIHDIDDHKRNAITRMLGTTAWEKELYSLNQTPLFSSESSLERNADVPSLERYVQNRLKTVFAEVLQPLPLPINKRPQMFSLFFAISSHNHRAIALAKRIANHILASGRSSHVLSR
jgi:three-Cys-motif partner protein